MRSRHNSSYWQGKKYLGLGPSAHSYNLKSRQWNISNNNRYIESIANGLVPFEKEELSAVQALNEYIMISLRTSEGIDLKEIQRRFGFEIRKQLLSGAEEYLRENKMILEGGFLVLSRKGKLLADGIAAHLFFENEENLKSSLLWILFLCISL
jgi:oxygen-independent coproporphyrinogen-3 oxidase